VAVDGKPCAVVVEKRGWRAVVFKMSIYLVT